MHRRKFLLAAGAAAALGFAPAAKAAKIDSVNFADRCKAGDATLRLRGCGLAYYKYVIKGMAAGWYFDEKATASDPLADVAKRIEMEYFWSLKAATVVDAANKLLARNVPAERIAALSSQIDKLHSGFVNLQAGDRVAVTYVPGVGTWLSHNGKAVGSAIPGPEFAATYFRIWFGDDPMDAKLKHQLLGG